MIWGQTIPELSSPGAPCSEGRAAAAAPRDAAIAGSCNRNQLRSVGKEGTILPDGGLQKYAQLSGGRGWGGKAVFCQVFSWKCIHSCVPVLGGLLYAFIFAFIPKFISILNSLSLMTSTKHGLLLQNLQAVWFSYSWTRSSCPVLPYSLISSLQRGFGRLLTS